MMPMDQYSMERWMIERQRETTARAELRARLQTSDSGWRLGEWMAPRLRRLADRLDGGSFEAEMQGSSLSPSSPS
jgi:hypothetical protein